jgi:hypothetical protein
MGKAHQNLKKTAQPKRETNALATREKMNTKQYSNPYRHTEFSYGGQPPALSI